MKKRLREHVIHSGRIPSAETCRDRGWDVGTRLASTTWYSERTIVEIKSNWVRLLVNSDHRGYERVYSFSEDVFKVEKSP